VFAVGQEVRVAAGRLRIVFISRGRCYRRPAVIRYTLEWTENIGREHDRALLVPGTTASFGRVTQSLHRAATGRDLSQFAAGEKSQVLSIRRPEGEDAFLRAGQQLRLAHTQALHKDGAFPVSQRDERELLAVGRQGWSSFHNGIEIKARRMVDLGVHQFLRRIQPPGIHRHQHYCGDSQKPAQSSCGSENLRPAIFTATVRTPSAMFGGRTR
jgi:hypothetical protein